MMPQRDIEKLLGGYATDTLTEEERKELFAAALRDQTLFNALADEHALKEVLDDPRARRLLIDALKKKTAQRYWLENFLAWLRRPSSWALGGSVAVALLAITFVIRIAGLPTPATERMAGVKAPPPPTSEPAAPAADKAKTPEPTPFEGERQKNKQPSQAPSSGAAPAEESGLRERRAAKLAAPESFAAASDSKKSVGGNQAAEQPPAPSAPPAKERDSAYEPEVPSRMLKYQGLANRARPRPNLRYTLLRRGPDGLYAPVDPATNFKAGEAVRIAIEPSDDGYLYALWEDEAGKSKMVFPTGETGGVAAKVEKDRRYLLPPEDAFTFPAGAGDQRALIVFSPGPLQFPEKLEFPLREKNAPVNTRAGSAAEESARTEAEPSPPSPQAAPQQPAGSLRKDVSPVTIEILLKHR